MPTIYGTNQNDRLIGSQLGGSDLVIDALEGDDYVELAQWQIYQSGPGDDTIVFKGDWGGYAAWQAIGPIFVNLAEGYARDSFGGFDTLVDVNVVHISDRGGEVVGSLENETVFCFGGSADLSLGGGFDTVHMWDLDPTDFTIRQSGNQVRLVSQDTDVLLTDVESLWFGNLQMNLSLGSQDGYALSDASTLHTIVETEVSEGWWYAGEYNEPQTVGNFPQAGIVTDIGQDGDLDVVVPVNRGYRTGVDTRAHFQVFENNNGTLEYSETLTSKTPFIAGSRRSDLLYVERYDSNVLVTTAHDAAIETETRTDIPWRLGDISFTRLDTFTQVTQEIVPENTLPDSDYVNRYSAVNSHAMAVGDINCDGMDDVLVGQFGEPFALLQTDEGTFDYQTDPLWTELISSWKEPTLNEATSAFPLDLDIDDYNGDGYDDILFGRGHGTTLSRIFFNDGTGNFNFDDTLALPPSVYGASNNLHMKTFSEDFDNDGDIDLVILQSRNDPYYGGNYLQYLTNDGEGQFTDETALRLVDPSTYEDTFSDRLYWTDFWQVLDYDNDGDLDIAGHTINSNQPLLLQNSGSGLFELDTFTPGDGRPIAWADFNQDGNIEVLQTTGYQELAFQHVTTQYYSSSVSRAFDIDGNAGAVAKVLGAVFGADSVNDHAYVGAGLSYMDTGNYDLASLGALAMSLRAPTQNSIEICEILWKNVVGESASFSDIAIYVNQLESGELGVGELVPLAANTTLNSSNIGLAGMYEQGLEYIQ